MVDPREPEASTLMLTRLKVSGFRNLADVDVCFGPFTCITGPNGVGKSNLFDAVRFLSLLADLPLAEAACRLQAGAAAPTALDALFTLGPDHSRRRMHFEAEMIVPREAVDDLGQTARASTTFLRYVLCISSTAGSSDADPAGLRIESEELDHINIGAAPRHVLFRHSRSKWRDSVVTGRRNSPLISTEGEGDGAVVTLHTDGGLHGRPVSRPAACLPRTVLSTAEAAGMPTVLCARREMSAWSVTDLDTTAQRLVGRIGVPSHLGPRDGHLPAGLRRLTQADSGENAAASPLLCCLREFAPGIRDLSVTLNQRTGLLELVLTDAGGRVLPTHALPGGLLRFLALAALSTDPMGPRLVCLESPEAGMDAANLPKVLRLLRNSAADPHQPASASDPLRQVAIVTHCPAIIHNVPAECLLVARPESREQHGAPIDTVRFHCLPQTWRARKAADTHPALPEDEAAAYRIQTPPSPEPDGAKEEHARDAGRAKQQRRDDSKQMFLPLGDAESAPDFGAWSPS